jgi:hypothetical protein
MQEAGAGAPQARTSGFLAATARGMRLMVTAERSIRFLRSPAMQNHPKPAEPQEPPVKDHQPYKDPIKPPPGDPQEDRPLHDPVPPGKDQPRI